MIPYFFSLFWLLGTILFLFLTYEVFHVSSTSYIFIWLHTAPQNQQLQEILLDCLSNFLPYLPLFVCLYLTLCYTVLQEGITLALHFLFHNLRLVTVSSAFCFLSYGFD